MDQANTTQPDWRQRALLGAGVLALTLACGVWLYRALNPAVDEPEARRAAAGRRHAADPDPKPREAEVIHPPHGLPATNPPEDDGFSKSFLDSFQGKSADTADAGKGPVATNAQLQKQFDSLDELQERLLSLQEKLATAAAKGPADESLKELKALQPRVNKAVADMENALRRARQARPKDPVPQWLTGEVLLVVRAEPVLILPYFQRAIDGGLKNSRLWASLARTQVGANHFENALETARQGIAIGPQERYAWNAFKLAAFSCDKANQVLEQLPKAFPEGAPAWVNGIRQEAVELDTRWHAEQKLRQAEDKADNLPRVRLVIEHRRFVLENGKPTAKVETTGREEALVELFEDQAPATVANFLTLVSKKFYDGTKFYLAEPASLVAGGCPLTKNDDPADDGSGGPGYFIPDEFKLPKARGHFRGSLSMVRSPAPNSAGSRFLITLVPQPWMDGQFTVFGRVIKGQEAIDRITQGRTHPEVAEFGRIIPGDVLVRAEIVRKRNHEYQVIKASAPIP